MVDGALLQHLSRGYFRDFAIIVCGGSSENPVVLG